MLAPLQFPTGTLNRAVMALWDCRPDLVKAFPEPGGKDLHRFVTWLTTHRGAAEAGLHSVFLAEVSEHSPVVAAYGRYDRATLFASSAPDGWPGAFPQLADMPLREPGTLKGWLNEPAPGAARSRPVITRLGLMIHQQKPDVWSAYPDPLGQDQAVYAYWFVRFGARELGLHSSLVRPTRRSLRARTRLALALRGWRERFRRLGALRTRPVSLREQGPTERLEEASPSSLLVAEEGVMGETVVARVEDAPSPVAGEPRLGVVLVSYRGTFGVAQVGRYARLALRQANVPTHHVVLDPVTLEQRGPMPSSSSRRGFWAVTLIHANADETPRVVRALPPLFTSRSYKIGYWFWELAHFPLSFADSFNYVDEVWAPTTFCLRSYQSIAAAPLRLVPPCVPPRSAEPLPRGSLGMDSDRFYFLFCFDAGSFAERKNPNAAIEALRQLQHKTDRKVGLVLKVTGARQHADLVSHLVSSARGLPVVILTDVAAREEMDGLIATCDAFLSLHRSEGLGLLLIESLYLGRPVVATDYGGTTDFIDQSTGYPVGYKLRRIEQAIGPYPLGAVWAEPSVESAMTQMLAVLSDPDEAAKRVAAGQRRVDELYGIKSAGERYAAELARVERILAGR